MSTHRKGIACLKDKLKLFDESGVEVEISNSTRTLCEVDYYGVANNKLFVFEYKSNDSEKNRVKAISQLERIAGYHRLIPVNNSYNEVLLYYCSGRLVDVEYVGRLKIKR